MDTTKTKGRKAERTRTKVKKTSKYSLWSPEEDEIVIEAFTTYEGRQWKHMVEELKSYGKTASQCLHRWQKVLDPSIIKGNWTLEEDSLLSSIVLENGPRNWSVIASNLPGRIGKQCRERWYNHLDPMIKKDAWTEEEDEIICKFHAKNGNKWSELSKLLVGRPSNAIKNHWNSTLKKRKYEFFSEEKSKKLKKNSSLQTDFFVLSDVPCYMTKHPIESGDKLLKEDLPIKEEKHEIKQENSIKEDNLVSYSEELSPFPSFLHPFEDDPFSDINCIKDFEKEPFLIDFFDEHSLGSICNTDSSFSFQDPTLITKNILDLSTVDVITHRKSDQKKEPYKRTNSQSFLDICGQSFSFLDSRYLSLELF
jgi:hypothetical protein